MIRFACPGCNATYSVPDDKGGKTGSCPKCQARFVIPSADPPAAGSAFPPPPPPPLPSATEPVEIAPCLGCQARLSVEPGDLGTDVECPYCKAVYTATRPGTAAVRQPTAPPPEDRPSRRRRDNDDGDRPSRRGRASDDEDDRPSRRRRDDDADDDRPRRRGRNRRSLEAASGPATTGMVLGIIGMFAWCCPLLGFIIGGLAIKYGNQAKDLSGGETGTAGVVLGWICVALSALNCVAGAILRVSDKLN